MQRKMHQGGKVKALPWLGCDNLQQLQNFPIDANFATHYWHVGLGEFSTWSDLAVLDHCVDVAITTLRADRILLQIKTGHLKKFSPIIREAIKLCKMFLFCSTQLFLASKRDYGKNSTISILPHLGFKRQNVFWVINEKNRHLSK